MRRVAISGASGLVGRALSAYLARRGWSVVPLVRCSDQPGVRWDPLVGILDSAALEGFDAVVHLAGESLAEGRWTAAKMARIRSSRVSGTRLLSSTLADLKRPPSCLVAASAIGYYGDRGDQLLDENSSAGRGFLAEVCQAWEAATHPAVDAGIRTVNLRLGVVLAAHGGALAKMLTPFRLGLGGVVGDGRQWVSWIELGDLLRVIEHAIETPRLAGALNAVAAEPVTQRQLTRALGRALARPTFLPLPAFAARWAFGSMADELLLASTRVDGSRLVDSGAMLCHRRIEEALARLLRRPSKVNRLDHPEAPS